MIRYTVRTVAGFFKIECDIRDFEEALRIVRKRQKNADAEKPKAAISEELKQKLKTRRVF